MKRPFILCCLCIAFFSTQSHAQLLINELMQSNVDCIMDDLNDFPDSWVELYNSGTDTIALSDYRLGITDERKKAWRLPELLLPPQQHTVVFCDKEGKGLHTNFRLESANGCNLFLFTDSLIADSVTNLQKQPAPNIAYGRMGDGGEEWGYMLVPTPSQPNDTILAAGILQKPRFSTPGRVQTSNDTITLRLSVPKGSPEGTEIRYTTDGSEPTAESTLYDDAIKIGSSTQIRATLFCKGYLSPRSVCHSYIFFPEDRPLTLPVMSIVTDNKYLFDSQIGIYTEGSYQSDKPNYQFDWRRPVNIELFDEAGAVSELNQLCETRIFGGTSRTNEPRSMVIYAHKRFGTKRLSYEFFPDQRPGVNDYKSIALRNAGQDYNGLYMRDAIIQRTMAQNSDLDWQSWRPVIVYINGNYWGIFNMRDRTNEDNIYTYYDGLEDIDLVENFTWIKEGSSENFTAFKDFYSEPGHSMAEYSEWIDCEEFINLMAMNMFFVNYDFPGTNNIMWRPRTEDGRWRWIAKDTDHGMGLFGLTADYNYVEWINNPDYDPARNWANKPEHTLLFRQLMEDADFKRAFVDHLAVYMGDFLNERGTRAVWDPMYEEVKTELPYHFQRFNIPPDNYPQEMEKARTWLAQRPTFAYQQLADYYHLGTPTPLTVNKGAEHGLRTTINNIPIKSGYFDGMYFADSLLTLTCTRPDGQLMGGWRIEKTEEDGTVSIEDVYEAEYTFAMPACKSLSLEAITISDIGIHSQEMPSTQPHTVYSLQGIPQTHAIRGVNIIDGKKRLAH